MKIGKDKMENALKQHTSINDMICKILVFDSHLNCFNKAFVRTGTR